MEDVHNTHKATVTGWVSVLQDWRRSRARRRIQSGPRRVTTPWSLRAYDDWTA